MVKAAWIICRRDLKLALRQGVDGLLAVMFFIIAVSLFPFGVGPEPAMLTRIAPGVLWVSALLAQLLALDRLFQADYDDGSLDLLVLSPISLTAIVLAKVLAHWLISGLPLILAAPVLAVLLHLPTDAFEALVASMVLGTPTMSLIGAVGAALVLGARRSGVLLALLVLPLYIPVMIFGVAAIDAALLDEPVAPHLAMLGALLLAALALAPWTAASTLKQALR